MFAKLRKGGGWPHLERWLEALSAHPVLAEVAAAHAPKGKAAKMEEKAASGRGGGGECLVRYLKLIYAYVDSHKAARVGIRSLCTTAAVSRLAQVLLSCASVSVIHRRARPPE